MNVMEADSPIPADDMSGKPLKAGHGADASQVSRYSPLTTTENGATTDSSHAPQQDLTTSVNSQQLHEVRNHEDRIHEGRNHEGHNSEGDQAVLTRHDGSRLSATRSTSHSEFDGKQREAYPNRYPTHKGINTFSMDFGDLQELAQTTSHLTRQWSQDLFSIDDNSSHSTDAHQIATSFLDKRSPSDKSSHTTDSSHVGNTATATTILKKNTHSYNWVSFEDEDDSVESTSDDMFTAFNHHPVPGLLGKHMAISNEHSTNSSWDTKGPNKAKDTAIRQRTRLDSDSSTEATSDVTAGLQLIINAASLKKDPKRASAPIFSQGHHGTGHQRRPNLAYPASYSETQHNGVKEMDTSHRTLLRPQSVDTTLQVMNKAYHVTDDPLSHSGSLHHRRKQFALSYGNSKYFSLPEDSNPSPSAKDCQESERHLVKPTIFRTSSSASLHSDGSVNTAPAVVPPHGSWKSTLLWVSAFVSRKGTSAAAPIDDSMEFGRQLLSPTDKVINAESNSLQQREASLDQKCSPNIQQEADTIIEKCDPDVETKLDTKTAIYKKRWYLLFLFSLSAMLWNAVWSTWGPIAQSAKDVYHWTDGDIAMFIWLGNIPFLLTMFPCSYLMDVKGMRTAMIVACVFMFLGTGFRCIPSDISTATWLIRIGQFLNGMAGTIPNSAPALLSGLWFPPGQRASATAISTVAGYMGASVSFVIGPLLVPQDNDLLPINNTDDLLSFNDFFDTDNTTNTTSYNAKESGIMHILYGEFAVAGLLLVLVLIYFPSKPPLPPSVSASMPREKYLPGIKMLVRNKQFWVCAIAFSVPIGVYESWQVILDVILDDKGVSQQTAGWLDFYATVGGCVSGLLVCRFADFFTRQMKLFLLVFYFFASVSILWFTLVVFDILPFDRVSMYAAIIIAGVFLDGGGPLFFELTIEVSYPVGEGVTSGFTQMLCALAGICFLSVVQVESLGKQWINWCFLGCVAMAIPLLFFITTTYGRADLDDGEEDDEPLPDTDEKTYLFGSSHV